MWVKNPVEPVPYARSHFRQTSGRRARMKPSIYLTFAVSLALALLLPYLFSQAMLVALAKLQLSPTAAVSAFLAMLFGGFINIPVARRELDQSQVSGPVRTLPLDWQTRTETKPAGVVIAVNLGGCIIPTLLALYEVVLIAQTGSGEIVAVVAATACNIAICYLLAKPAPGIGIFLPGFIPPLMAAGCAYLLSHDFAAPVAFVAGTMGPLIGADLLHLNEINEPKGIASIGGAGTFDGIVLSGLLAALLT